VSGGTDSAAADVRVLHVAECFGGGVLQMISLVSAACARAGSAQLIAYGRRPETPIEPRRHLHADVELVDLDWRRRSPRSQVAAARRLRRVCADWLPDVVHLHSSFAGALGGYALAGAAPLIYTPHAFASTVASRPPWRQATFRSIERFVGARADVVGAVSQSEAAIARDLGGRKVLCIPNGIAELEPALLAATPSSSHPPVRPRVIAVGRLTAQRQPGACARILAAVADITDIAWIGGGGDDGRGRRASYAALAAAGAQPTGWVDRDAVLQELRDATVYLHWTAGDGQALSLLEAMACDAVIVASDIAANRDLVDQGQLCADEDVAATLIRRIVAEPAFAAELLETQRSRRRRHSASEMASTWLETYRQLSGRAPARAQDQARVASP
jgi:glycosyltransferase involved in cell wall biosynthesis